MNVKIVTTSSEGGYKDVAQVTILDSEGVVVRNIVEPSQVKATELIVNWSTIEWILITPEAAK